VTELRFYVEPAVKGGHVFDRHAPLPVPVAYCPVLADAVRIAALLNGSEALAEVLDPAS
jgi:hypothetical protein